MGLGILEPSGTTQVPGTVLLDQQAAHSEAVTSNLKHGTGKNSEIILAPQPSEDPNDPLNWPLLQKYTVVFIVFLGTIIHSAATALLLNAGTVQIAKELKIPIAKMVKLTGYYTLASGAIGPFVAASSRKYGKRPVFVFSSIFSCIGCIVGETAEGYNQLLAARLIQGMAGTIYETLVYTVVGDVFFVHERGPPMAVGIFVVNAISNCVQIIAGHITTNLGWRYNFHILIPFAVFQTLLLILFVPETTFNRRKIYDLDTAGSATNFEKLAAIEAKAKLKKEHESEEVEAAEIEKIVTASSLPIPPRKTMVQQMALYNGSFVDDSILKILISFPVIFLNLGGCFVVFGSGITLAWYAASAISVSVTLPLPPYLYTSSSVGNASVGPLIGALLATVFMGIVSDPLIKFFSRRNAGVYESEFQLPLSLLGGACAISGLIGLGYTLQRGDSIYLVCFVWGLSSFGLMVTSTSYFNYALSAYRDYASEIFVMSSVFRGFFGYGLASFVVPWLESAGIEKVFKIIPGVLSIFIFLGIVFYFLGKKYRAFWHRHNLYKLWRLETDKSGVTEG